MSIHASAIIDPRAEIGEGVHIGPYAIVGPHCTVGAGSFLEAHAVLKEYVRLGENVKVASNAVLGGEPQDHSFKGERSWVEVGANTSIRECVTINRASGEDKVTQVGERCMLMAYSHMGHNVRLGNEVILANAVQLGGYVDVDDYAFLGGGNVFHQFVRIGKLSIVGGGSAARQDVAPFSLTDGRPTQTLGINKIGLRRRGYDLAARTTLKKAFYLLFNSGMTMRHAIEEVEAQWGEETYIKELIQFMTSSKRGVCKAPKSGSKGSSEDSEADLVFDPA